MDTTMLFTSDVALMQRMTAVEEGRNENRKKEKEKDEQLKKRTAEQFQEEKEPETVVVKPYSSYDAYARKVTVYPFRSGGYNYEV